MAFGTSLGLGHDIEGPGVGFCAEEVVSCATAWAKVFMLTTLLYASALFESSEASRSIAPAQRWAIAKHEGRPRAQRVDIKTTTSRADRQKRHTPYCAEHIR